MQNGFLGRKSEARRETDECMGRGARVEREEKDLRVAGGTKMDRRTNENENEWVSLMDEKYVFVVVVARKIRPFEPHRSWSTQGKFS